jgi:hypothetical protein
LFVLFENVHKLCDNANMSRVYDRDPYAILGLFPTATASQVKEAYHRLARQYHPDLNNDPRAGERMKDINWAYELLSDPDERSLYDYWRYSNVRTDYYDPGSSPADHNAGGTIPNSPPYNPYRRRSYPNVQMSRRSSTVGCSSWGILWVIIIVITNLARAFGPSWSQQSAYDYSPEFSATQTAQMEKIESTLNAFSAAQNFATVLAASTAAPLYRLPVTPSPITGMGKQAEPGQEAWRAGIVPGSWEWDHIHEYFPELTTPDGLSDEVTLVTYDQLKGYRILTRSLGEYWILVDRINHGFMPVHYPATGTPIPVP